MRILFCGDSITKGSIGLGFIPVISQLHPEWTTVNLGLNGDTLGGIFSRLSAALQQDADYKCLVVQGGYNDLLLGEFARRGPLFRFAASAQRRKGIVAVDNTADLKSCLRSGLAAIRKHYQGEILLLTIGCVGEELSSAVNQKRAQYNKVIRSFSGEPGVRIADCGCRFDQVLSDYGTSVYCLDSFWAVTLSDPLISKFKFGPGLLSKRRGLLLTIDGVHLNANGAAIIGNELCRLLTTGS